jgi:hypothetical protein
MDNEKNQPVKKFRVGSVTASVWLNDGNHSVTIQKSYKDASGEWQNTQTLFQEDVVCAIRALDRAERFIAQ